MNNTQKRIKKTLITLKYMAIVYLYYYKLYEIIKL